MNFKLPYKFTLLGHEYEVQICENLLEKENIYGDANFEKKMIRVQAKGASRSLNEETGKLESVNITEEDFVETYFHELVHIILDAMGEHKLCANEKFVSLMGKCLMEIEKTKKDGKNKKRTNSIRTSK